MKCRKSKGMPRGPYPFGRRFEGKSAVKERLGLHFKGIPMCITGTDLNSKKISMRGCDLFEFDH
jgi:hypothetical protein